MIFIRTIL